MCDGSASPRSLVRAVDRPELLPGASALDRGSRSKAACFEQLLSPCRTLSGSTHATATTPSPRRKATSFVWADVTPSDEWDDDHLPEASCNKDDEHLLETAPGRLAHGRSRGSSPGHAGAEQAASAVRWQPNARAPEFIPTTSMECVLVGVSPACPHGRTPGLVGLGAAPAEEVAQLMGKACSVDLQRLPAGGAAESASSTPSAEASPSRRRRSGTGKRRPPPLAVVPADSHGEATRAPGVCSKGKPAMPEATEEEWQHRVDMRIRAVEIGKDTKEYRVHCETKKDHLQGRESQAPEEPMTPDPYDRTLSKRTWKYLLRQWRTALAQRCLEDGPDSVVSTEEYLSTGGPPAEDPEGPSTVAGDSDSESTSEL